MNIKKFIYFTSLIITLGMSNLTKADIVLGGLDLLTNIGYTSAYQDLVSKIEKTGIPYVHNLNLESYIPRPIVVSLSKTGDLLYTPIKDYPFADKVLSLVNPNSYLNFLSYYSAGRIINILNDLNHLYFSNLILKVSIDGLPYLVTQMEDGSLKAIILPLTPHFRSFLNAIIIYRSFSPLVSTSYLVATKSLSLVTSPYIVIPSGVYFATKIIGNFLGEYLTELTPEEAEDFYQNVFLPEYLENLP